MGSLATALGSYLHARHYGGAWLIRIDDIDQARAVKNMDREILECLDAHLLQADEPVYYSAQHSADYKAQLEQLVSKRVVFRCSCSRRDIKDHFRQHPDETPVYPGFCRDAPAADKPIRSYRARVDSRLIQFEDAIQGFQSERLAESVGDFVICGARQNYNYQLATVVDDHLQQISHVVRGADLINSTARQIYLQQLLGLSTPVYMHLPVVVDQAGQKLSKQQGAEPVDRRSVRNNLRIALTLLGQPLPKEAFRLTPQTLLAEAIENWTSEPLTGVEKVMTKGNKICSPM